MSEWAKRVAVLSVGDMVAYSKAFLQSTGQFTGDAPLARGTVTKLEPLGDHLMLAAVDWHGVDLPAKVNIKNLVRVKDGVVMERE